MLGRYQKVNTETKRITDFDERVIAGPNDQMYKDALDLARLNGHGYSEISDTHFADMKTFTVNEDTPDTSLVGGEEA